MPQLIQSTTLQIDQYSPNLIQKTNDLLYKVALGNLPNVGSKNSRQLIAYCGSAENVFKTTKAKLLRIPGIGEVIANTIKNGSTLFRAEEIIEQAFKSGVELMFFTDDHYPTRLKQIPDAPPLIYYKGNASLNSTKILSVVGTRNITPYGREMCNRIIADLAHQNIIIISGLAYGVDICAHRAAIRNGLPTIGVMATGMDKMYPSNHLKTAEEMLLNGGLLTEESFGTQPTAQKFPARNRIVAGLSDAVLVIESAAQGGSLITADMAFDYDKEIFAVPGEANKRFSEGCNNLIKNHKANLVTEASDIVKLMNWDLDFSKPTIQKIDFAVLDDSETKVIHLLQEETIQSIDELSWKLGINSNKMASILLKLEFDNFVQSLPGRKFKLKS